MSLHRACVSEASNVVPGMAAELGSVRVTQVVPVLKESWRAAVLKSLKRAREKL